MQKLKKVLATTVAAFCIFGMTGCDEGGAGGGPAGGGGNGTYDGSATTDGEDASNSGDEVETVAPVTLDNFIDTLYDFNEGTYAISVTLDDGVTDPFDIKFDGMFEGDMFALNKLSYNSGDETSSVDDFVIVTGDAIYVNMDSFTVTPDDIGPVGYYGLVKPDIDHTKSELYKMSVKSFMKSMVPAVTSGLDAVSEDGSVTVTIDDVSELKLFYDNFLSYIIDSEAALSNIISNGKDAVDMKAYSYKLIDSIYADLIEVYGDDLEANGFMSANSLKEQIDSSVSDTYDTVDGVYIVDQVKTIKEQFDAVTTEDLLASFNEGSSIIVTLSSDQNVLSIDINTAISTDVDGEVNMSVRIDMVKEDVEITAPENIASVDAAMQKIGLLFAQPAPIDPSMYDQELYTLY